MKTGLAVLVLITAATALAAGIPTAEQLAHDIRMRDSRSVIHDLSWDKWDKVVDQIATGKTKWIGLAPLLASGTDAGSGEDLGIVLAFVLPKNPRAVLEVSVMERPGQDSDVIGINRVCSMPFIEDTEPPGYARRTIAALAHITSSALTAKRARCLELMRKRAS